MERTKEDKKERKKEKSFLRNQTKGGETDKGKGGLLGREYSNQGVEKIKILSWK